MAFSLVYCSVFPGMECPLQKKYNCQLCRLSTDNECHLKRHQYVHLSYEDKKKLKVYWCECGHNTNRAHDMKRHKETCKGKKKKEEMVLSCSMCEYETNSAIMMARHQTIKHGLNKKNCLFQCSGCAYKSHERRNMIKHIKGVHVKGQTLPCDICRVCCASHLKLHEHMNKCHVEL